MKLLSLMFKWLGIKQNVTDNRVVSHLVKEEQLNSHLIDYKSGNELHKQYIQYLPDRYAANLSLYHQTGNFFNYDDVKKWTNGFYENNAGDLARFFCLNLCIDQLMDEKISGDMAELGVFKGNSAFLLARFARLINAQCYLFDTFEGFDERDLQQKDEKRYQQDFSGTSLNSVQAFVGEENVVYVKGFFPASLQQIDEPGGFALVHIDCDLEAPFRAAPAYFYPRLIQGAFLIMQIIRAFTGPALKARWMIFLRISRSLLSPCPINRAPASSGRFIESRHFL